LFIKGLSRDLKGYSLKKEAIIAGLFDRLEIWDEGLWNKYKAVADKDSSEIAEALGEMGV